MSDPDDVTRLAKAVSGSGQATGGIAVILEGRGGTLMRLLEAANEKPLEETKTDQGADCPAGSADGGD